MHVLTKITNLRPLKWCECLPSETFEVIYTASVLARLQTLAKMSISCQWLLRKVIRSCAMCFESPIVSFLQLVAGFS